jgi:hypothetical protein
MDPHQAIEQFTLWAVLAVGGSLVLVLTWGAKQIIRKLEELSTMLARETHQLRELYHAVDKRVMLIENHCNLIHNGGTHNRRRTDRDYDREDGE